MPIKIICNACGATLPIEVEEDWPFTGFHVYKVDPCEKCVQLAEESILEGHCHGCTIKGDLEGKVHDLEEQVKEVSDHVT